MQLLPAEDELVRQGFAHKRVQVLQPDVILDAHGSAYVIEMNTNGFMVGALHADYFDATPEMASAAEISGVNRCARARARAPFCPAGKGAHETARAARGARRYPLRPQYSDASERLLDVHCALENNWPATAAARELERARVAVTSPRCDARARMGRSLRPSEREAMAHMFDEWSHAGRWLPVWPPRDTATFRHVQPMYTDLSRSDLRGDYWTEEDGVLLRFSRWLQLDAAGAYAPGSPTAEATAAALQFAGAEHQRAVDNRTEYPVGCTCAATGQRPTLHGLQAAIRAQQENSQGILPKGGVSGKVLMKLPRLDKKRFPDGYVAKKYDATYDNGKSTTDFEEYDASYKY